MPPAAGPGPEPELSREQSRQGTHEEARNVSQVPTIEYNGRVYTCPYHDVMPPLTAEELAALRADIERNGVICPVVISADDEVIDGHNRLRIAAELGLSVVPINVMPATWTPDRKWTSAIELNLARRHLNGGQKRELSALLLKQNPDRSNRDIAAQVGIDHKTVAAVRKEGEAAGEIPQLAATTGKDGKKRPARRKPAARGKPEQPPVPTPANGEQQDLFTAFVNEPTGPDCPGPDEVNEVKADPPAAPALPDLPPADLDNQAEAITIPPPTAGAEDDAPTRIKPIDIDYAVRRAETAIKNLRAMRRRAAERTPENIRLALGHLRQAVRDLEPFAAPGE